MMQLLRSTILAIVPFFFVACGELSKQSPEDLGRKLDIDVGNATQVVFFDNHGGLQGDGVTKAVLQFKNQELLRQIENNPQWELLPMPETIQALLRQSDFSNMGLNLKKALPIVKDGRFRLIDRHPKAKEIQDPLKRDSINLTLAVYDIQSQTLYVVEIDT